MNQWNMARFKDLCFNSTKITLYHAGLSQYFNFTFDDVRQHLLFRTLVALQVVQILKIIILLLLPHTEGERSISAIRVKNFYNPGTDFNLKTRSCSHLI